MQVLTGLLAGFRIYSEAFVVTSPAAAGELGPLRWSRALFAAILPGISCFGHGVAVLDGADGAISGHFEAERK